MRNEVMMSYAEWEICHKRRLRKRRAEKLYYLKQKLSGAVLIAIGVIVPLIDGDATFSLLAMPLGLYLIFTKEKVMMFKGV